MTAIESVDAFIDSLRDLLESKDNPDDWYVLSGEQVGRYSVNAADVPDEIPDDPSEHPPEMQPPHENVDGWYQIGTSGWSEQAFDDTDFVGEVSFTGEFETIDRRINNLLLPTDNTTRQSDSTGRLRPVGAPRFDSAAASLRALGLWKDRGRSHLRPCKTINQTGVNLPTQPAVALPQRAITVQAELTKVSMPAGWPWQVPPPRMVIAMLPTRARDITLATEVHRSRTVRLPAGGQCFTKWRRPSDD